MYGRTPASPPPPDAETRVSSSRCSRMSAPPARCSPRCIAESPRAFAAALPQTDAPSNTDKPPSRARDASTAQTAACTSPTPSETLRRLSRRPLEDILTVLQKRDRVAPGFAPILRQDRRRRILAQITSPRLFGGVEAAAVEGVAR